MFSLVFAKREKKKRERTYYVNLSKYQSHQTCQRFVDCTNILQGLRGIEVKETFVKKEQKVKVKLYKN